MNDSIMDAREADADQSLARKVRVFKEAIECRNKYGWNMSDDTSIKNAVCIKPAYLKGI